MRSRPSVRPPPPQQSPLPHREAAPSPLSIGVLAAGARPTAAPPRRTEKVARVAPNKRGLWSCACAPTACEGTGGIEEVVSKKRDYEPDYGDARSKGMLARLSVCWQG